jgi:hypothetical protein
MEGSIASIHEWPRRGLVGNSVSDIRNFSVTQSVPLLILEALYVGAILYVADWGYAEFMNDFPVYGVLGNSGGESTPGGRKHYQHDDKDKVHDAKAST